MMTLLSGFAALALLSGALLALLGEGSMRHAAAMAAGLVMLLYWSSGLQDLLADLDMPANGAPATVLTSTSVALPQAEAALAAEASP